MTKFERTTYIATHMNHNYIFEVFIVYLYMHKARLICLYLKVMVLAFITAAARPEIGGQAIRRRIRQGVQAFFEYQVPSQGFTIRVTAEEGRLAVCGSRTLQRPSCIDSSLYDWRREVTTSTAVYITPEGLDADSLLNNGGQVPVNITLFVSFEGLVANNSFVLGTTFADTRILQGNHAFGVTL